MNAVVRQAHRSWFRSPAGLRFGVEVGAIVLAKIVVLILLYVVFIAPQPRTDTSPASVRAHVLAAGGGNASTEPAAAP
jgi:hypothetical protein